MTMSQFPTLIYGLRALVIMIYFNQLKEELCSNYIDIFALESGDTAANNFYRQKLKGR